MKGQRTVPLCLQRVWLCESSFFCLSTLSNFLSAVSSLTQRTQRTQEVANDMAGICHVIWLASN